MLRKVNGLSVVVLRTSVHHTDVRTGQNRHLEAPPTTNPKKDAQLRLRPSRSARVKPGTELLHSAIAFELSRTDRMLRAVFFLSNQHHILTSF